MPGGKAFVRGNSGIRRCSEQKPCNESGVSGFAIWNDVVSDSAYRTLSKTVETLPKAGSGVII
jgi:hypothetical protein